MAEDSLSDHGTVFSGVCLAGGFYDHQTGKFYPDSSAVYDKETGHFVAGPPASANDTKPMVKRS